MASILYSSVAEYYTALYRSTTWQSRYGSWQDVDESGNGPTTGGLLIALRRERALATSINHNQYCTDNKKRPSLDLEARDLVKNLVYLAVRPVWLDVNLPRTFFLQVVCSISHDVHTTSVLG